MPLVIPFPRLVQRRFAVLVSEIGVGAAPEQHLGDRRPAETGRVVQRRRTLTCRVEPGQVRSGQIRPRWQSRVATEADGMGLTEAVRSRVKTIASHTRRPVLAFLPAKKCYLPVLSGKKLAEDGKNENDPLAHFTCIVKPVNTSIHNM